MLMVTYGIYNILEVYTKALSVNITYTVELFNVEYYISVS